MPRNQDRRSFANRTAASGESKDVFALEKERPFLLKEDRKSLIGRNDRSVGLDLGKIRIYRGVKGYVGRSVYLRLTLICFFDRSHSKTGPDREFRSDRRSDRSRSHSRSEIGIVRSATARFCNGNARHYLKCSFILDIVEARDLAVFDQEAGNVSVVGHPLIELVVETVDVSGGVETPQLSFARRVPQRLEGYLDLDDQPQSSMTPFDSITISTE